MTTFAIVTTIASFVIFAGFVALSVVKFGWQKSYSAYAALWKEAVPIHNANLWSIVTIAVAALLAPAMIDRGASNPWQFLGFFAPIYLAVVAFTPNYQTDEKQRRIHISGALVCACITALWALLICRIPGVVILSLVIAWIAGIATKTIEKSLVFWAEMGMFLAVFTAPFI